MAQRCCVHGKAGVQRRPLVRGCDAVHCVCVAAPKVTLQDGQKRAPATGRGACLPRHHARPDENDAGCRGRAEGYRVARRFAGGRTGNNKGLLQNMQQLPLPTRWRVGNYCGCGKVRDMKTQVYQNRNPHGIARTEIGIPLGEWVPGHTFYLTTVGETFITWLIIHEQSGTTVALSCYGPLDAIREYRRWVDQRPRGNVNNWALQWQEKKACMWADAERDAEWKQ